MTTPTHIQRALGRLVEREDLSRDEAYDVMRQIMRGEAAECEIAGYLIALRMKGATTDEIVGSAKVMREMAQRVTAPSDDVLDTCGTGGDGAKTINISTAAALVAAAAGCTVAKHGNRAVSSSSGSADVLEALGVRVDAGTEVVERCMAEAGVGFMFAPAHHGATRHAMPVRRALGVRTVFNLLGPLTNPAGANRQLVGVYAKRWVRPLADVLGQLGSRHALVVHGSDGLDEITITGPTHAAEWRNGSLHERTIDPADFGMSYGTLEELRGGNAAQNARILREVFDGGGSRSVRHVIALNAAAALYVGGRARDLADGLTQAQSAVRTGRAAEVLDRLVSLSGGGT